LPASLALVCGWVALSLVAAPDAPVRVTEQPLPLIVPGLKYTGNASCGGSGCHGADKATVQSGQNIGDELNVWTEKDPHANAWKTLTTPESAKIAASLKLPSAAESSDRCLSCHTTNVPMAQRGEKFSKLIKDEAVSCESCHGPSEKWLSPHAKAGWTTAQRSKLGPQGLFDQFTLIDTHDLMVRANRCVSCHLQIDKELLDAGHPALEFELYAYNYYVSKKAGKEYTPHWDDAKKKGIDAVLWYAGQSAGLTAAKSQAAAWKAKGQPTQNADALVSLYEKGQAIAQKSFGADAIKGWPGSTLTPASILTAAGELAKLSGDATITTTAPQRRTIVTGVTALGSAWFDVQAKEGPDAFWQAYDTALKSVEKGGPEYTAAVADLAKQIK
jgi:hypothetical protein